jgi:ribosomal protein S6
MADKENQQIESEMDNTVYEVGFLLLPTIAEDKIVEEFASIKKVIESHKSSFISEDRPKMISLAYSMIKKEGGRNIKYDTAYFGWIKFETTSDMIGEIKKKLDELDNVLRFMIVKTVRENTISKKAVSSTSKSTMPFMSAKPPVVKEEKSAKESISKGEIDEEIENLVIE